MRLQIPWLLLQIGTIPTERQQAEAAGIGTGIGTGIGIGSRHRQQALAAGIGTGNDVTPSL